MGGFEPVDAPIAVFDVGGVLLRLDDEAHLRELAHLTGRPIEHIRKIVHASGLYDRFDGGEMPVAHLVEQLRRGLDAPGLSEEQVRYAWGLMLSGTDAAMCDLAARLAAEDRLLLATNCSPLHWLRVQELLAAAGVPEVPAVVSCEVLVGKPDPRYFDHVRDLLDGREAMVFVDDREANTSAAAAAGLPPWLHRDSAETVRHITALAWPGQPR